MFIMAIIYKFVPKKRKKKDPYSQHFIQKVSAKKVTEFLMAQDPCLPKDIAESMSFAIITSTHLQLLLEEHGLSVPSKEYDEYTHLNYLDHGSETIH